MRKIFNKSTRSIYYEIGVNHECSIKHALKLVGLAKKEALMQSNYKVIKQKVASKYAKAYWDTKKENQKINLNCSRNMTILATKRVFSKDVKLG